MEYPEECGPEALYDKHLNINVSPTCNFLCEYCSARDSALKRWSGITFEVEDAVRVSKSMNDNYGVIYWGICGPEPTQRLDIIEALAGDTNYCNVSTNMSTDPLRISEYADPSRVSFSVSFHPTQIDIELLVDRMIQLRGMGYNISLGPSIVAWPPLLNDLSWHVDYLIDKGLDPTIHSFFGLYNGNRYPESYTEYELALIDSLGVYVRKSASWGGDCRAGYTFGMVAPDGTVTRCPGDRRVLGNINDVINWDEIPQPCGANRCVCKSLRHLWER